MKHPLDATGLRVNLWSVAAATGLLLGSAMAAGCGGSDPEEEIAPTAPATSTAPTGPTHGPAMKGASSRGTFEIEITPQAGPIPTNEPFNVKLMVTEPLTGEAFTAFDRITLDARMPEHDHGMTREVELVATDKPGEYMAEGLLFHMIGYWEFHVDVVRGSQMERAQVAKTLEF